MELKFNDFTNNTSYFYPFNDYTIKTIPEKHITTRFSALNKIDNFLVIRHTEFINNKQMPLDIVLITHKSTCNDLHNGSLIIPYTEYVEIRISSFLHRIKYEKHGYDYDTFISDAYELFYRSLHDFSVYMHTIYQKHSSNKELIHKWRMYDNPNDILPKSDNIDAYLIKYNGQLDIIGRWYLDKLFDRNNHIDITFERELFHISDVPDHMGNYLLYGVKKGVALYVWYN